MKFARESCFDSARRSIASTRSPSAESTSADKRRQSTAGAQRVNARGSSASAATVVVTRRTRIRRCKLRIADEKSSCKLRFSMASTLFCSHKRECWSFRASLLQNRAHCRERRCAAVANARCFRSYSKRRLVWRRRKQAGARGQQNSTRFEFAFFLQTAIVDDKAPLAFRCSKRCDAPPPSSSSKRSGRRSSASIASHRASQNF